MRALLVLGLTLLAVRVLHAQGDVNVFAQPIATTVQLPTFGVSFDADGVLQLNTHTDPTGKLVAQRLAAARADLPGNLARATSTRKISIVRLQAAVERLAGAYLRAIQVTDAILAEVPDDKEALHHREEALRELRERVVGGLPGVLFAVE